MESKTDKTQILSQQQLNIEKNGRWELDEAMKEAMKEAMAKRINDFKKDQETPRILGIDVSDWQMNVNWEKVAASGIQFAYIKCSEGNKMRASLYEHHARGAQKAGILIGAYHFARPNDDINLDAQEEAKMMLERMSLVKSELPPCLDLEATKTKKTAAWAKTFCETISKETGRKMMVYVGRYFWPKDCSEEDRKWFSQNTYLWIPAYPQTLNPHTSNWPKGFGPWESPVMWQYAGDPKANAFATCDGVRGACDRNVFRGSLDDLKKLCEEAY